METSIRIADNIESFFSDHDTVIAHMQSINFKPMRCADISKDLSIFNKPRPLYEGHAHIFKNGKCGAPLKYIIKVSDNSNYVMPSDEVCGVMELPPIGSFVSEFVDHVHIFNHQGKCVAPVVYLKQLSSDGFYFKSINVACNYNSFKIQN